MVANKGSISVLPARTKTKKVKGLEALLTAHLLHTSMVDLDKVIVIVVN